MHQRRLRGYARDAARSGDRSTRRGQRGCHHADCTATPSSKVAGWDRSAVALRCGRRRPPLDPEKAGSSRAANGPALFGMSTARTEQIGRDRLQDGSAAGPRGPEAPLLVEPGRPLTRPAMRSELARGRASPRSGAGHRGCLPRTRRSGWKVAVRGAGRAKPLDDPDHAAHLPEPGAGCVDEMRSGGAEPATALRGVEPPRRRGPDGARRRARGRRRRRGAAASPGLPPPESSRRSARAGWKRNS